MEPSAFAIPESGTGQLSDDPLLAVGQASAKDVIPFPRTVSQTQLPPLPIDPRVIRQNTSYNAAEALLMLRYASGHCDGSCLAGDCNGGKCTPDDASAENLAACHTTDATIVEASSGLLPSIFKSKHQASASYDYVGKRIVVKFRGSVSFADYVADAKVWIPKPIYCTGWRCDELDSAVVGCEGCAVQRGFVGVFKALLDNGLDKAIDGLREKYPGAPLAITGHSLGGTVSQLAAIHFKLARGLQLVEPLYTFGALRTGNEAWANFFNRNIQSYSVVHMGDPVPSLADAGILPALASINSASLGYRRAGIEVWYNTRANTSKYKVCNGGEDPACSNSLWKAGRVPKGSYCPHDHFYYLDHPVVQCAPFIAGGAVPDAPRCKLPYPSFDSPDACFAAPAWNRCEGEECPLGGRMCHSGKCNGNWLSTNKWKCAA